jgi:hypothetical protein
MALSGTKTEELEDKDEEESKTDEDTWTEEEDKRTADESLNDEEILGRLAWLDEDFDSTETGFCCVKLEDEAVPWSISLHKSF